MRKTIQNDTKKAVIYCRVSSKEQAEEGNSLVTQERICREYANKKGYSVADIFIEQGESAKTADRTELQRLLKLCTVRKNRISSVIIYKIDRLSRNIDDYSQIRILLRNYGVRIESTSEKFEDTPTGRFMENLIANVAQFDNDVRTERTINGMRDAVREGRYVWTAPLGYDNVRSGGKSNIAPNHLAPLVHEAFVEVAKQTGTLDDIRRKMEEKGLVRKDGKRYSKSRFYEMLRNDLYAGWINKFGERHKGLFKPIVTQEIFDAVQHVVVKNRRRNFHYERENPDFPLRRFVQNGSGVKATGCWSQGRNKKYPYYRFRGSATDKQARKADVETAFLNLLGQIALTENRHKEFTRFVKKEIVEKSKERNAAREQLVKHIEDLKKQERAIIKKNLDGIISDEILRQQLHYIEDDIQRANISLDGFPDDRRHLEKMVAFIENFLKNPGGTWQKMAFKNKLKLQWCIFPQGIVYENGHCRTDEVSFIFKAEKDILDAFSCRVSPENHISVPNHLSRTPEIVQQLLETGISNEIERFCNILESQNP